MSHTIEKSDLHPVTTAWHGIPPIQPPNFQQFMDAQSKELGKRMSIDAAIEMLRSGIQAAHQAYWDASKYTHPIELVTVKPRRKFIAIDIGNSGAWLIEKETGEIYNIKSAYGVPDYNKKKKADLGNVLTADPAKVYAGRWNYLRNGLTF